MRKQEKQYFAGTTIPASDAVVAEFNGHILFRGDTFVLDGKWIMHFPSVPGVTCGGIAILRLAERGSPRTGRNVTKGLPVCTTKAEK
jgi:hypothetical protein